MRGVSSLGLIRTSKSVPEHNINIKKMPSVAKQHYDWCVERAMAYFKKGDLEQAKASFLSDMGKNAETKARLLPMITMAIIDTKANQFEYWINGFDV